MTLDFTDPATLLASILTLDLKNCAITVCIASGNPDENIYTFRRVMQSEKLAQKFREAVAEALSQYREALEEDNIELSDFVAETAKPEQEIEYLNILPYDSIKQQISPVDHYLDMDAFQHDDPGFIRQMRFYVVRIQPPASPAINFYQHYSPSQMLSRSHLFAMWLQRDTYDDLDQPTFLFERHIDCFSCEEHMFILQKSNFFKIFSIGELEKVARETLEKLEKKDFIQNFQRFKKDSLNNKIKILKLKNISTRPYLDTLTVDDLHKTINRYNLPIQVDLVGNKKKLVYNPKSPWAILHLLDDAYADSSMTKNSYYLKGKREIRRK
ncbi:MAG TPA: Kiwa anti-phage protein KwaB-like domain-containing protein [Ktedonobacteraceae bacterium]|nr:Kiwa anti-phage protein KwaB-like domain-containing protein [Ktedonobacteraceae bacterium]